MKSISDNLTLSFHDLLVVIIPGLSGLYFLFQIGEIKTEFADLFSLGGGDTWKEGVLYFSISFFIGYVIYVFGSMLDTIYDRIKSYALGIDRFGIREGEIAPRIINEPPKSWLVRLLFPHLNDTHNLIVNVIGFKNRDLGEEFDKGSDKPLIDVYQYCYRRLMIEAPTMFLEAERYFVNARFFRSMSIVLAGGSVIWLICDSQKVFSLWIFFTAIVSFFTYFDRWRKANHVALKSIIILEKTNIQRSKGYEVRDAGEK